VNEYIDSAGPVQTLDARRAFLILGVFLLIQFLTAIAVVIVVLIVFLARGSLATQTPTQLQTVALVPAALVGTTLACYAAFRMTRETLPGSIESGALSSIGWSWGSGQALLISGLIGAFISWFVLYILIPHAPPGPIRSFNPLVEAAATPGLPRLGWALLIVAVAPPSEEFLFRGVLLEGLRRSWGLRTSGFLVTGMFIAGHLLQTHYWTALLGISLLAIATLCIRLVTRALGPSLVAHAAYNFVILVTVYARAL